MYVPPLYFAEIMCYNNRDGEPVSSWQLDDVDTDFPEDKYQVWDEETGSRVRASLASYLAGS